LKDYGLAEDVMQETFLKVREHAGQYHGQTSPKAWIMTITRNLSLNMLRQREHETCDPETLESITTETEQDQQRTLDFYRALAPLDKQEQSIIIMKIVAGFRHNEIAEIIGLKTADVRKRYSRALQKLKKYFNDSAIRKGD
jgi:RNA polymerase sigma-70 factor (ECF subfamily)